MRRIRNLIPVSRVDKEESSYLSTMNTRFTHTPKMKFIGDIHLSDGPFGFNLKTTTYQPSS